LRYEVISLVKRLLSNARVRMLRHCLDRQMKPPAFLRSLTVPEIYRFALFDVTDSEVLQGDVALFRATQSTGDPDDEPYSDVFADPFFGWTKHVSGGVHAVD